MAKSNKWVYSFGGQKADGDKNMKNLLGGKGANLAEMTLMGLSVPPGFTISTDVCNYFYQNGKSHPSDLADQVAKGLTKIEKSLGLKLGDPKKPLLLSIRSGARVSMPGMMDTVLNLGLNDETAKGLAKNSGDARFAADSYRRFIQMYGSVVLELEHHDFEDILENHKRQRSFHLDTDMSADDWYAVIADYKNLVQRETGKVFPQDPHEQMWGAINAVFKSWMNNRAITYRKMNEIPEQWGTAVTVQSMVFGNLGDDCATGVCFTRNPSTGENSFYGEFLVNAQGEDVVAGIRTPQQLTIAGRNEQSSDAPSMEEVMPDVYQQLCDVREILEKHYRDMQDIEFTVQQGKLFVLQTRSGKRTTASALKIAVDMVHEGSITQEEAIERIAPTSLDQLLHPTLDPKAQRDVLTKGLPASPGAAVGRIVFTAEEAERMSGIGDKVILCRVETSPEDILGMYAAAGILTARGGMTSHAAVVARGMGRPCVSGAGDVRIDYKANTMTVGGKVLKGGDIITIDGGTGEVMNGAVPTLEANLSGDFAELMTWADSARRLKVRTNAETPHDAETARRFGAEGIGLCRTEHMFFDPSRIMAVREMIVAESEQGRRAALAKLEPFQQKDFFDIFKIMAGLPVTIRLLDPPLHEFLPHHEDETKAVAEALKIEMHVLKQRLAQLHEANPMLGHRGCRLGITYPEIYEMQARAIFAAAKDAAAQKIDIELEIMIPLVATKKELSILKAVIDRVAEETAPQILYKVGVMIELPRAALMAGQIAEEAEFFSFGTNDLTQTTLGLSRDDAGNFLPDYQRTGIYLQDPFVSLDQEGVGQLITMAAGNGRRTRPGIKLGICGEHGGDPHRLSFAKQTVLIMSHAHHTACQSRVWRQHKRPLKLNVKRPVNLLKTKKRHLFVKKQPN